MPKSAKKIYKAFRESMLANTNDWKDLLAENVTLVGPLAQVEGKEAFIAVNVPFFDSIVDSVQHQVIKKGDFVLTRITTTVNTPAGTVVSLAVSEWYEISDGLIQSLTVYFDTFELRGAMA